MKACLSTALLLSACGGSGGETTGTGGSGTTGSGDSGTTTGTGGAGPSTTTTTSTGSSSSAHPSGAEVAITWGVLQNPVDDKTLKFSSELTLTNNGKTALGASGWSLYFNFVRAIDAASVSAGAQIQHVNGDLFRLEPKEGWKPIAPGESLKVTFDGDAWAIMSSDAPAGFYFVFEGEPVGSASPLTVKPFTDPKQTTRFPGDKLPVPTAASRYQANTIVSELPSAAFSPIVPAPTFLVPGASTATLSGAALEIHIDAGLDAEGAYLAAALADVIKSTPKVIVSNVAGPNVIRLRQGAPVVGGAVQPSGAEAYTLEVLASGQVEILGSDPSGVFYGIQSLRQLAPLSAYAAPADTLTLPTSSVADTPRYHYRGLHLDSARNFQGKAAVKKLLDLMAFYKLNRFHFHLTDDEGFRLEIKSLPELTDVGSVRGHSVDEKDHIVPSFGSGPTPGATSGSGHYSRADFIEILKYAKERHIEVIPEIEFPGHARASIKAMAAREAKLIAAGKPAAEAAMYRLHDPEDASVYQSVQGWTDNVVNPCQESTYAFAGVVFDDIVSMYAEAGATLTTIHTGGDEVPAHVWEKSKACEAVIGKVAGVSTVGDLPHYFLRRISDLVAQKKLVTGGWEEIALTKDDKGAKVANPEFLGKGFLPYAWNNVWGWGDEANAYKLTNAGYKVVINSATNLYFDLAYEKDPEEPGYYWAGFVSTRSAYEFVPEDLFKSAYYDRMGNPVDQSGYASAAHLDPTKAGNIAGVQGNLWSENIKSPAILEYLAAPRVLALAERAWTASPSFAIEPDQSKRVQLIDVAWNRFANSVGRVALPILDHIFGGVGYRLPPPGAVIQGGKLRANAEFPGLTIRYTTDGSEPTETSAAYAGPVDVAKPVKLKTFDTRGRGSRTVTATP